MGIEQWSAVGALLATIIGSVTSMLFWLNRRHSELTAELHRIHLDMRTIESVWSEKMHHELSAMKADLFKGPPWLRELMQAQQDLLKQALKNGQIAIDVAEQHGNEMLALNNRIEKIEGKQDAMIDLISKRKAD